MHIIIFNLKNQNEIKGYCFINSRMLECEGYVGFQGRIRSVLFNLFRTVAHFSTQGILTTHFGQQNLISDPKS